MTTEKKHPSRQVEALRDLAHKGNAKAQFALGVLYERGQGLKKNARHALLWYHKAAEQGGAEAQCALARQYANGVADKKDDQAAMRWYHLAAEQGNAEAQYQLAEIYAHGRGLPRRNFMQAEFLYAQAADQGHGLAAWALARHYREKQPKLADGWRLLAAESGVADAQRSLATAFATGDGTERDEQQAMHWYALAARQGDPASLWHIGCHYRERADYAKARSYYRRAAELGLPAAQSALGLLYAEGLGMEKNPRLAAACFRKASEQGDAEALHNLAQLYLKGEGVQRSVAKARDCLEKAAAQGVATSRAWLGLLHARGDLGEPDLVEACKWFILAGANPAAQTNLKQVIGMLDRKEFATAKRLAKDWLKEHRKK